MQEIEIVLERETNGEIEINLESEGKEVFPSLENLTVNPNNEQQVFTHENSYGYDKVTVNAVSLQDKSITINENGTHSIVADDEYSGLNQVNVTVDAIEDLTEELTTYNTELTKQETTIEDIIVALNNKAGVDRYNEGYAEGEAVGNTLADSIVERTITEFTNHRITKIGSYAFAKHSLLTKIDIPNVTLIDLYGFNYCSGLTEIVLPSVKRIESQSFNSCGKLTKIDAPVLEYIGAHSITASKLTTLIIRQSETVCTLANTAAIQTTPMTNGTGSIYVPDSMVEAYKSATNWSTYASQIKPLSELGE